MEYILICKIETPENKSFGQWPVNVWNLVDAVPPTRKFVSKINEHAAGMIEYLKYWKANKDILASIVLRYAVIPEHEFTKGCCVEDSKIERVVNLY